jgi:hypothetical protein
METFEYILAAVIGLGLVAGIVVIIVHLIHTKPREGSGSQQGDPAESGSALVRSLLKKNAKMYGAGTCTNTQDQIRKLGEDAGKLMKDGLYIQCSTNAQAGGMDDVNSACRANNYLCPQKQDGKCMSYSAAYPTWCFGNDNCCQGVMDESQLMQSDPCKPTAQSGGKPQATLTSIIR